MRKKSYSSSIDYLGGGSMSLPLQICMLLLKGQLLRLALISYMVALISGMGKMTLVLPSVLFRACLVRPTKALSDIIILKGTSDLQAFGMPK